MIDLYFDTKNNILKNKLNITDYNKLKIAENYYYNLGIATLSRQSDFSTDPDYINHLHHLLFHDVYDWAGKFRLIDMERYEMALGGLSLNYSPYKEIEANVNNIFLHLQRVKLSDLSVDEKLDYIVDVLVKLWHVHPFRDCNTRTLIPFVWQYCSTDSLSFRKELLKHNFDYFRRSLVAASFEDEELGVKANKSYLLKIMRDAFKNNYKK